MSGSISYVVPFKPNAYENILLFVILLAAVTFVIVMLYSQPFTYSSFDLIMYLLLL